MIPFNSELSLLLDYATVKSEDGCMAWAFIKSLLERIIFS